MLKTESGNVPLWIAEEQSIHPELKAEAEGIVAALENAGFQGLGMPGQLSKLGEKSSTLGMWTPTLAWPFTLGRFFWQSIWLAPGSQGQIAPAKELVNRGCADVGEGREKSSMLPEAAAAKGAILGRCAQRWDKWTPALAWLALFLPILFIGGTTWKLSSEIGSWRMAGCSGV